MKKVIFLFLLATAHMTYAVLPSLEFITSNATTKALDTYAGQIFGWLACEETPAKTAVTAVIVYSVAYTLFQTLKGFGGTVVTWIRGEKLSPAMKCQVELYLAELMKKHEREKLAAQEDCVRREEVCQG